jgi:hypothetical protein
VDLKKSFYYEKEFMMKKLMLQFSLAASMVLAPISALAVSSQGIVGGSSESVSAMIEKPSFEKQVQRAKTGTNLLRLGHTVFTQLPIAQDSIWVDVASIQLGVKEIGEIRNSQEVKKDPYFATATITAMVNGDQMGAATVVTPLTARLYYITEVVYKNPNNPICKAYKDPKQKQICQKKMAGYHLPNMNILPTLSNLETFRTFPKEKGVALIDVTAKTGTLYPNIEDAIIALAPDASQEEIKTARDNYEQELKKVAELKGKIKELEAKIKDDKNAKNPHKKEWEAEKTKLEKQLDAQEKVADAKQEILYKLLDKAALDIKNNFDKTKVPLAKKISKMVDVLDDLYSGSISMYVAATAGLVRGYGAIGQDLQGIQKAIAMTPDPVMKAKLSERLANLPHAALMTLPMIGVGTYFASKDLSLLHHFNGIVDAVMEGQKALEKAQKAKEEAEAKKEAKK